MINRRIGSFIAALRKEQNLTQAQFAEKLGVTNRSVSRWENGYTLPDLSLMQSICQVTGITLSELLSGARQDPSGERKERLLPVLALWDREKQAKIKTLNIWFSLGLITLLTVILAAGILNRIQSRTLVCLGVLFHGIGFYRNNRDRALTEREKEILVSGEDAVAMQHPDELLTFARKKQNVSAPQYKTAFRMICDNLAAQERVSFVMAAEEYSIDGAPGIWHAGVAVTQNRILLCGETVAGRVLTRTVLDAYSKEEILSVQHTNRSILLKTARGVVTIKGNRLDHLGEAFQNALRPIG